MTYIVYIKLYTHFSVGNCDCDCVQKYEELINIQNVLQKAGFLCS